MLTKASQLREINTRQDGRPETTRMCEEIGAEGDVNAVIVVGERIEDVRDHWVSHRGGQNCHLQ